MRFNITSTIEVEAENKEDLENRMYKTEGDEIAKDLLRNAEIDEISED